MRLSLCLETVFVHRPFVDRMKAATALEYPAIEFRDWQSKDLTATREAADRLNLAIAAISGNRQHCLTYLAAGFLRRPYWPDRRPFCHR